MKRFNLLDLAILFGLGLCGVFSYFGYRLYSAGFQELLKFEENEENRVRLSQGFSRAKPEHISFALHSKLPAYLRRSVALGDAEIRELYQEFPMKILAIEPMGARRGESLLLLSGKAARTSSGLILTGFERPVRLGEQFQFSTKKYRLSGSIVRIFRNPIDPKDFAGIARQLQSQL